MSRRLVLDASVVSAASGTATAGQGAICREPLNEVFGICHRVVVTEEIQREWRDHESRFATRWLVAMRSRRKVLLKPGDCSIPELTAAVGEVGLTDAEEVACRKDLLLVEAALGADLVVVSRDKRARALFVRVSAAFPGLQKVTWANPETEGPELVRWLQRGAPYHESAWLLRPED